jgi:ABC-type dipeptide/oligopeptide/nickel transport system ATPase component
LGLVKIGINYFERDTGLGKYPVFSYELNRRVARKEACVVGVVGEAGTSKSYTAIQLARNIDKRFGIDQIVFTYADYVKELGGTEDHQRRKQGIPVVFDEPSYAMGKREWYKQINQALVKTVESQRFLVRPLIIPIININLLDKTLRDFLMIFQVHMTGRGRGLVYRMRASQGEDKTYRYLVCRINYPILDFDECPVEREAEQEEKNKSSCLDCDRLKDCTLLRAQYERKKAAIQRSRYAHDEEEAKTHETKELTLDELCSMIKPYSDIFSDGVKIDTRKLRFAFHEKLGMKIGYNKSYEIKTMLELRKDNSVADSA